MWSKIQPKPFQTTQAMTTALIASAVAYAILLVPTVLVHLQSASGQVDVSRLMDLPWSEILSLSKQWKWLIDFGMVLVGGMTSWIYWRSLLTLSHSESHSHTGISLKTVLLWTAVFAVILAGVIPFHSRDVFGYINRGAEQVVYGVNPYLVTVEGIKTWHEDPLFHEHWIHNPCPYGFFFAQATAWIVALGGKTFWGAFLVSKGLNMLIYVGLTVLLYQTVLRLSGINLSSSASAFAKPQALFAAMMFGWNPLMLMQLVGNGHNDLWVGGGLVLTLFFAMSDKQWHWMWPVFILTALVKYTVLLLVPVLLVWSWTHRSRIFWGRTIVLSILVLGFSVWPYAMDLPHFPWDRILDNATLSQHSFHSALSRTVQYLGGGLMGWDIDLEQARKWIKWLLCAVVIGVLYVAIKRLWKASQPDNLTQDKRLSESPKLQVILLWAMTVLMVSFLLIASAKFHAWYIGSFFPLLCLFPKGQFFQRLGVWLSVFQLGAFTFLENVHILNALLLNGVPLLLAYYDSRKTILVEPVSPSSL